MAHSEDGLGRLNIRVPQAKLEWLREELDSFTTDTGRVQFLIQYYSDDQEATTASAPED